MKRLSLMLSILLLAGCDRAGQTDQNSVTAAKTVGSSAAAENAPGVVTDFKSPELAGLVVRDYPDGVQVVTSPSARGTTPPPIGSNDLLWSLSKGAVFTSVNDTPVRDARHFRELMDALEPGKDVRLGQQLFLEDAGNGMVSIRSSPPDDE